MTIHSYCNLGQRPLLVLHGRNCCTREVRMRRRRTRYEYKHMTDALLLGGEGNAWKENTIMHRPQRYLNKPHGTNIWQMLSYCGGIIIPWVAAQVVRWSSIPVDARSRPGWCTKSCFVGRVNNVQYVELRGYCPWGWGVRPVNWIYHLCRPCQ